MNTRQYAKLLTMTMYDVQALRKAAENRCRDFKQKGGDDHKEMADELHAMVTSRLIELENEMATRVEAAVADMPVMAWLNDVHGIGPRLSGSLVSIIEDISRFSTISRLWAYCGQGLIPICTKCDKIAYFGEARIRFCMRQAERRWQIYSTSKKYLAAKKKGTAPDEETYREKQFKETEKALCQHDKDDFAVELRAPQRQYFKGLLLTHNPFAKMTAWKISGQFARQGKFYREIYEKALTIKR